MTNMTESIQKRVIQRRKVSGQIPHRTDGNKEEKRIWKKGREDIGRHGVGVVRTSHTGKGGTGLGMVGRK